MTEAEGSLRGYLLRYPAVLRWWEPAGNLIQRAAVDLLHGDSEDFSPVISHLEIAVIEFQAMSPDSGRIRVPEEFAPNVS